MGALPRTGGTGWVLQSVPVQSKGDLRSPSGRLTAATGTGAATRHSAGAYVSRPTTPGKAGWTGRGQRQRMHTHTHANSRQVQHFTEAMEAVAMSRPPFCPDRYRHSVERVASKTHADRIDRFLRKVMAVHTTSATTITTDKAKLRIEEAVHGCERHSSIRCDRPDGPETVTRHRTSWTQGRLNPVLYASGILLVRRDEAKAAPLQVWHLRPHDGISGCASDY